MAKTPHKCPQRYNGDGAKGGCFVSIEETGTEGVAYLEVGHSCVISIPHRMIPVTWIAEVLDVAARHEGGIPGFLRANDPDSYALMCDPDPKETERQELLKIYPNGIFPEGF